MNPIPEITGAVIRQQGYQCCFCLDKFLVGKIRREEIEIAVTMVPHVQIVPGAGVAACALPSCEGCRREQVSVSKNGLLRA